MGFSADAGKVLKKEVLDFRFGYAEQYNKDLTLASMQNPTSDPVKAMAFTYHEDGLPHKEILPGKTRWTANTSAAQTGQAEGPIPEHERLKWLQKLIAHQNYNLERNTRQAAGSSKEKSVSDSEDFDRSYAREPQQQPIPCGTQRCLRSSRLLSGERSAEVPRVAPVARMGSDSALLEQAGPYTYGGLPNIVDLEAHDDHATMTSESRDDPDLVRDVHQDRPDGTTACISADPENNEGFLSGLAHQSLALEEGLLNVDQASHQQSPTETDNSTSEQRAQQSDAGQTAMVGPYQRPSKVIVLKWKQRKRQHGSLDEGRKRQRLEDMVSIPAPPQPNGSLDSNSLDTGYPVDKDLGLPVISTHHSSSSQAAAKPPDGGSDNHSQKERTPTSGNEPPNTRDNVPGRDQGEPGQGATKVGLKQSIWLLDPRKPGGSVQPWPERKLLSQSIQYVFNKTTELLQTDGYDGIQFLFRLDNRAGECTFRVAKGAPHEFQLMKDSVQEQLMKAIARNGRKATAVELTLEPLGLAEVDSGRSATTEDQDACGFDAFFE